MLRQLTIRSFALIDDVALDFDEGMTVLVGETGAGKSIIIDALAVALGGRMSSDMIRKGAKKCVIEATFDASSIPDVASLLKEHDLTWESSDLIMRRELTDSGTSRCFVNDTPTTAAVARDLAAFLMDFHGQHDTHGLLNVGRHRTILDAFADVDDLLEEASQVWQAYQTAVTELESLRHRADKADDERRRLEHLLKEIDELDPVEGEDESVALELRRSESREQIIVAATSARNDLYVDENSAYELLRRACDHVRTLIPFDADLEATVSDIENAMTVTKEGAATLTPFVDDAEDFSAERLEELRSRLAALQRLSRKYGTLEVCCHERIAMREQLEQLSNVDESLQRLESAVASAHKAARSVAKKLHDKRTKTAQPLASQLSSTIVQLGIPAARIDVSITEGELSAHGFDTVEFLFSANTGEEVKPLARIASGGELSRFMLALKKSLSLRLGVGTMVFDEIDTGISGKTARQVGGVMKHIAERQQLICITHLPQIASLADHMIVVEKADDGERSNVTARAVVGDDIVHEVARLLSGATITDAALQGAREMINEGTADDSP
jgi:DNA repair protein RecN (Recombination protein N)